VQTYDKLGVRLPLPPPSEADVRADDNINAANILKTSAPDSMVWAIASLEDVTVNMVEETVPSNAPQTIALTRLDTDWHASTKLNSTIPTACDGRDFQKEAHRGTIE
jgi:hypothetical protein